MNRQIFHQPELQRIDVLDSRFYTRDKIKFFPSSTTILGAYPKGEFFEQWLKDVGANAKEIAERAGNFGSKIHQATEDLNNGIELRWIDDEGKELFTITEWKSLLKYADFWRLCTPELIANEASYCSEQLRFGGTLDRVVMIADRRWLIDIKTSNYLSSTHELQLASYAMLWNEFNPEQPIEETGIMWLKASTRTEKIDPDKKIFQGLGWQLKSFDRHYTDAFKLFQYTQFIWENENPNYRPANLQYPDTIKL